MKRHVVAAILAIFLAPFSTLLAQTQIQNVHGDMITVMRSGTAFAKPDLGILTMALHSSEPVVEEAAAASARKTKAVESALAVLGYSTDQYEITSVVFGPPRNMNGPQNQSGMMGYEATQFIYVFFEGSELGNVAQLASKEAAAIEALRKAGAVPATSTAGRLYRPMARRDMIVYTVKDSDKYEQEALQQALKRAREAAMEIAGAMQVHITSLISVRTGALARAYPLRGGITPLYGLPYRFYSTRSDEVQISARATLNYVFKP